MIILKKLKILLISWLLLPINVFAYSNYIIPGGETLGIEVNSKGVMVIGFYQINGKFNKGAPAIKAGDYIVKINDVEVNTIEELTKKIISCYNEDYKKTILVVDDDPMMLKLIKEQLKDSYTVATAVNGAIALKFLETRSTDLILLDYEMPGQNGAQILEKIRNNPTMAKLPVIFLTGMKDKDKITQVVQMKPQGYLLKPIEREALINSIKRVIG